MTTPDERLFQQAVHEEANDARRFGSQKFVGVRERYVLAGPVGWTGEEPAMVVCGEGGKITAYYSPFVHAELPGELAKIRNADDEQVLQFVHAYGRMGYRGGLDWGTAYPPSARRSLRGGDPIPWLRAHGHGAYVCLEITKALNERWSPERIESLLSRFGEAPYGLPTHVERPYLSEYARLKPADKARSLRKTIINENIKGVHRQVGWDFTTKKDQSFFDWEGTVSVVYWHLANLVDGGTVKRCEAAGCGGLFIQTDPRQRFCPKQWRQRESACAMRERQRKHREK